MKEPISAETDRIARSIVNGAFRVHRELGPGLLESVYQLCLVEELIQSGLMVRSEVMVPIVYRGSRLDGNLRLDLLVQNQVIVELKAVETMHPVYDAQMLTYLKLTGVRLGLLINFNVPLIKQGIKRIAL
jgi:GxxExxY protein